MKEKLKFGTGGLRGIMGKDIDVDVVKSTTQGLSEYILKKGLKKTVVVSYDSRNNSRLYAESTAGVFAANGIRAYLFEDIMPVPVLSFSVRYLEASFGIMITASHNRKEYNGYKVYKHTGGQILDAEAQEIEAAINSVTEVLDNGKYEYADSSVYEAYKKAMNSCSDFTDERDINIVYSPLNGSGRRPVTDMFAENGFNYIMVKEQEMPDGNFPTCPYPNPEKTEVYDIALRYADQNTDIILATDPDSDRVGAMVRNKEGEFVNLTGNDIGMLISYYLCQIGRKGTIVSTIVSTPMVDRFMKDYDVNVIRTHVGFKYIGDKIEILKDDFLFGFEESNGYLVGQYTRDKDGVLGTKLVAEMAAHYKKQGKKLTDVLEEIYDRYGRLYARNISVEIDSIEKKDRMMASVRNSGVVTKDYLNGADGLPKSDVLEILYEDGAKMIVRPSGTEPKVKLYMFGSTEKRLNEMEADFEGWTK